MFVFTRRLREPRLDRTVKNGPGLLLGLFLFPPQHNFPPVNCSVFLTFYTSKNNISPAELKNLNSLFSTRCCALADPMFSARPSYFYPFDPSHFLVFQNSQPFPCCLTGLTPRKLTDEPPRSGVRKQPRHFPR